MTLEEQRIAVAKECGYKKVDSYRPYICWVRPNLQEFDESELLDVSQLPDYPNDLNAMAGAEKVLTPDEQEKYSEILSGYLPTCSDMHHDSTLFPIIHMTSQQRCEAFLRTRGKWKE